MEVLQGQGVSWKVFQCEAIPQDCPACGHRGIEGFPLGTLIWPALQPCEPLPFL